MRIGILSDTHNELARAARAVEMLKAAGAEALVHCGDLSGPEVVAVGRGLPFVFVFGNHDADMVPWLWQSAKAEGATCLGWGGVVELGGKRVGVTHGHMATDVRNVAAERPHYLLSGHTHAPFDLRDGAVRRVNPGALANADEFSVAVLDLTADAVTFLTVPA